MGDQGKFAFVVLQTCFILLQWIDLTFAISIKEA